jgi:hypothetical protein
MKPRDRYGLASTFGPVPFRSVCRDIFAVCKMYVSSSLSTYPVGHAVWLLCGTAPIFVDLVPVAFQLRVHVAEFFEQPEKQI